MFISGFKMPMTTVFTIGHSTHAIGEFVAILTAHGIVRVVDVRTIPKSRRNPQFNSDELRKSLTNGGIAYLHQPGLGGLRHPRKDSKNTGWENESFRGYADYMETEEFGRNLDQLLELAGTGKTAIMCAESLPWKCHRSLLSDALIARGAEVLHIMNRSAAKPHAMTAFARVEGTKVTYPGKQIGMYLD